MELFCGRFSKGGLDDFKWFAIKDKGFSVTESEISCGLVSAAQKALNFFWNAKNLAQKILPSSPCPKCVTHFPGQELSHSVFHV